MYGGTKILILKPNHCDICFQTLTLEGIVPASGVLEQHRITTTASALFHEFEKHWLPYWMDDGTQEQFEEHGWISFMEELDLCPIPDIEVSIVLDDLMLWKKATKKLKANKAEGVCGWRHEELQKIPDQAIRHLMLIFNKLWKFGFTKT